MLQSENGFENSIMVVEYAHIRRKKKQGSKFRGVENLGLTLILASCVRLNGYSLSFCWFDSHIYYIDKLIMFMKESWSVGSRPTYPDEQRSLLDCYLHASHLPLTCL